MKKKPLITSICVVVVCIALIRAFTPYLGKPFLIYCRGRAGDNDIEEYGLFLSNDVEEIDILSSHEPCIKFFRYCTKLEEICVFGPKKGAININDISNSNLKVLELTGNGTNWSSLNNCIELKDVCLVESNIPGIEEISKLEKLEYLYVHNKTNLSLSKLNELKNITNLSIICPNDIDCQDFSQLEKMESLYLSTQGKISGLDKMDSVVSLTLSHTDQDIGNDICEMDNLKELIVFDTKFSAEVERALRDKGVTVEYME